jgi:hypothetical protein
MAFLYGEGAYTTASMVCLFHDDYGPADPAFSADAFNWRGQRLGR